MTLRSKSFLLIALSLAVLAGILAALRIARNGVPWKNPPVVLEGSVLTQSIDPGERTPLPGVTVTAISSSARATGKSDPTGYFNLTLNPGVRKGEMAALKFQKPGYRDLDMTATNPGDQLYTAQLQSLQSRPVTKPDHTAAPLKATMIKNVQVRYTFKNDSTVSVGSIAKQFAALNNGNVPCRAQQPCSPDGRWKATLTTLPLDAEPGNEFRNLRVSCIAGPCHFTRLEDTRISPNGQTQTISVLNWSDTADFLIEADVIRTIVADIVRQSYPFILGDTMNFALPPGSKGPTLQADLDGQFIAFPLGPALLLSWANCSVESSTDGNKIYRCQLKPGYQFQQ